MDAVGRSFNWILCTVIPVDSVPGYVFCWDKLYDESISDQASDSGKIKFMQLLFSSSGFIWDRLYEESMQIHIS
jgi:hypothetical protein